ncbi:MAG: hypothetical protein AB8B59_12650 [Maribacter sp.]
MSVIKSLNQTSEKAIDIGEAYYQKTQEYYKLKIFQQLTLTISMFCKIALVGSLLLLGFIFFAVSGTITLANYLDNSILACAIIASCLFLVAGIIYALRHKVETFIIKKTAKNFFD